MQIFEKAITGSAEYDDQFRYYICCCVQWLPFEACYLNGDLTFLEVCRHCIKEGKNVEEAYWELVIKDIQDACDLFLPVYKESNGGDGFISVEVSPLLANETQATIDSAKYLHQRVNRENVLIKIPATEECLESIKQVIASSISVNVTVSFLDLVQHFYFRVVASSLMLGNALFLMHCGFAADLFPSEV